MEIIRISLIAYGSVMAIMCLVATGFEMYYGRDCSYRYYRDDDEDDISFIWSPRTNRVLVLGVLLVNLVIATMGLFHYELSFWEGTLLIIVAIFAVIIKWIVIGLGRLLGFLLRELLGILLTRL